MRRIRSKDTVPELKIRKLVYALGYRYRLHSKDLPGKPDLVLRSRKKAIFIHGCFWHQHNGCKDKHIPKSNVEYWKPKLQKTVSRDKENLQKLKKEGWDVMVIWDCELKNESVLINNIKRFLTN